MSKSINRRDILKLMGGGIAGVAFTPIPWKFIDDLSIWTQNWSWIPVPLKGEISSKYNICTICAAGCAVRARCVADQPVSLWGIKGHPVNGGALCPLGFGGHHLPYHPSRVRHPVHVTINKSAVKTVKITREEVAEYIARQIADIYSGGSDERIAVLDHRPGRTVSYAYRRFLAGMPNGTYIEAGSDGSDSFTGYREIIGENAGPAGYNIEKARTIVSFGAPLFEGWGVPGRVSEAIKKAGIAANDKRFKLIQIETRFSHTASIADRWVPVKPGTEAIFALGVAHLLLRDSLIDTASLRELSNGRTEDFNSFAELAGVYTPQRTSKITGIETDRIVEVVRIIADNAPTLIVCGRDPAGGPFSREEQIAIWGLNFLLGNAGPDNLIVPRRPLPVGESFDTADLASAVSLKEIPDHSIRVLIVDDAESGNALPWRLIERKLVPEASTVVSLSPYLAGTTKRADFIVPAPTYLESYQDVPPSFDARTATYAVSSPLLQPPDYATEPIEFLNCIARTAGTGESQASHMDLIRERAGAIYRTRRGWIYTPQNGRLIETSNVQTEQQFWSHLNTGGYWIDEPEEDREISPIAMLGVTVGHEKLRSAIDRIGRTGAGTQPDYPLSLVPFGWRGAVDSGPVTPLITKLYQESEFRQGTNRALVHPNTGRAYGLRNGRRARIRTESGKLVVIIEFNESVMPGVVHVALGPDRDSITDVLKARIEGNVLSICTLNENGTWRVTPAGIEAV